MEASLTQGGQPHTACPSHAAHRVPFPAPCSSHASVPSTPPTHLQRPPLGAEAVGIRPLLCVPGQVIGLGYSSMLVCGAEKLPLTWRLEKGSSHVWAFPAQSPGCHCLVLMKPILDFNISLAELFSVCAHLLPTAPSIFLTHPQGPDKPCPIPESLLSLPRSQFSRNALVAINDNAWLKQLLLVTMEKIRNSDPFYVKDKVCGWRGRGWGIICRREQGKGMKTRGMFISADFGGRNAMFMDTEGTNGWKDSG